MKFRAHETFFIRKGWLSKGIKSILINPNVFMGYTADGITKINPMDSLGLGANMVKSLRYWLQAVGLTEEKVKSGRKSQVLTEIGELINNNDPYVEEFGTLCLLHNNLCTNKEDATAWYYFFNVFSMRSFSREDFITALNRYMLLFDTSTVARRSFEDDFNCIINTYVSRGKSSTTRVTPENNIDCPLGELELIEIDNRKMRTYRKRSAQKTILSPLIALAIILKWAKGESELKISKLLNSEGSIGKVFNLDTISLLSLLSDLENQGYLRIIRTAGLDVVRLTNKLDYMQCVTMYYESIN